MEFGHHSLELTAVQHPHENGFDDIVEVVSQGDFIAAQLFGFRVKGSSSHSGTDIAGGRGDAENRFKNIRLKKS